MEKVEECVLNGAQLANIDSKHAKSTRVCLDNITSECGTLNAAGGLDDASKISYVKDTENSEKSVNGAPRTLLGELQDPLNALIRCADIQRELFQSMMTMNELNTKEASDLSGKESSPRENKGEKPYSIEWGPPSNKRAQVLYIIDNPASFLKKAKLSIITESE